MKVELYCYRDRKAGVYSMPFAQHNEATAKRYFDYLCQHSDNHEYAADLELFKVGTFETDRGIVFGLEPQYICSYVEKPVIYDEQHCNAPSEHLEKEEVEDE